MSEDLNKLIEAARKYKMSPEERIAQVKSFAYGNTRLENPEVTKEGIDRAMEELQAKREHASLRP